MALSTKDAEEDQVENVLDGRGGDDILAGGDALGAREWPDTFIGGGNGAVGDTVTYAGRPDDVIAGIGGGADDSDGDDIQPNVENLTGGDGDDDLTGDQDANTVDGGGDGDDTLRGGPGPGPDGADTLLAGSGAITNVDTVSYAGRSDAIAAGIGGGADDGAGGCPAAPTCEGDNISGDADNLVGGSGADQLTGDGDANTVIGGAGADDLFGLGADDTLDGRDDGPDDLDCGDGPVDVALIDQIPAETS